MAIALLITGEQPNWAIAGSFAGVIAVCGVLLWRGARELRTPPPGWLAQRCGRPPAGDQHSASMVAQLRLPGDVALVA